MINELESTKSESAGSADVAVAIEPQTAPEENPAAVCETAAENKSFEQDARETEGVSDTGERETTLTLP